MQALQLSHLSGRPGAIRRASAMKPKLASTLTGYRAADLRADVIATASGAPPATGW